MSALCKPLDRLPVMFVKDCGYVPVVLTNAAFVIEKNIKTKNLFQTQGNVSKVNASLVCAEVTVKFHYGNASPATGVTRMVRDGNSRLAAPRLNKIRDANIHDIVEAMKTFLVRLPEPLLPENVCDALISIPQTNHFVSQYIAVLNNFRKSSPNSFTILHFMMILLRKISDHSEYNCMNIRKLATVFVLDILKPLKIEESNESGLVLTDRMQRLPYLIMVVENFINQVEIFKPTNNSRDVAPSPKVASMAKSNTRISTGSYRNNFPEIRILAKQSEMEQRNDRTALSMKDQEIHEATIDRTDMVDKKLKKDFLLTSFDLLTRTVSEPQQVDEFAIHIPKRCMTAIPVYNKQVFPNIPDPVDETVKNGKDLLFSETECNANPSEISHEPEFNKMAWPASVNDAIVMDKHYAMAVASTSCNKKFRIPLGVTCSPVQKKSANIDRDDTAYNNHNGPNVTANRSVDIKMASGQEKRKRKCRSTCRKIKQEKENSITDTISRSFDFVVFQPDEEITPWNEGSINSDDASVMVKTIRNPRILASKRTPVYAEKDSAKKLTSNGRDLIFSSDSVSQMVYANSFFRTISSQNNISGISNLSDSSVSSAGSRNMNIRLNPTSEVCVQCSSHEATPISKDLIRGVKLKGSVGVNTSPFLTNSVTCVNNEVEYGSFQKCMEGTKPKSPIVSSNEHNFCSSINSKNENALVVRGSFLNPASVRSHICNNASRNHTPSLCNPDTWAIAKEQGSVLKPETITNTYHQPSRTVVPGQVTAGSYLPATPAKFRHQSAHKSTRASNSGPQQKDKSHLIKYVRSKGVSVGEWFVNIILVCITFFCIFLVFFYHQNSQTHEGWLN